MVTSGAPPTIGVLEDDYDGHPMSGPINFIFGVADVRLTSFAATDFRSSTCMSRWTAR
jgi:hypothetical protein